jgi:GT2 family glycosyltransferase
MAFELAFFVHVTQRSGLDSIKATLESLDITHALYVAAPDAVLADLDAVLPDNPVRRQVVTHASNHPDASIVDLLAMVRRAQDELHESARLCLLGEMDGYANSAGYAADVAELRGQLVGSARRVHEVLAQFDANAHLGVVVPRGFWRALSYFDQNALLTTFADALRVRLDIHSQGYFPGPLLWCRLSALRPYLGVDRQTFERAQRSPLAREPGAQAQLHYALLSLSAEAAGLMVCDDRGVLLHEPVSGLLPWLPQSRWAPTERQWAEEAMQGWAQQGQARPTLCFAILPNPPFAEDRTQLSLQEQWLAADETVGAAAASVTGLNRAVQGVRAQWIAFVQAGDVLPADATFRIVHALMAHPEWELAYTDEDILSAEHGHVNPHFKPDINIDYLRSYAYIGSVLLVRKDLFVRLGGLDPARAGAELYDLALRAWEHFESHEMADLAIGHLAEVLVHRATQALVPQQTPISVLNARGAALAAHLSRLGVAARIEAGLLPGTLRVRWPLPPTLPMVSIIIPTRNKVDLLRRCLETLAERTTYPNYELVIVDNDSDESDTVVYLEALGADKMAERVHVLRFPGAFNFAAMNNHAVQLARGEFVLLLNNDTAAYHENWLHEMVSHGCRPDVGAVGARLLFKDGSLQHAGVVLGLGGVAGHVYSHEPSTELGHYGRAQVVQNYSAVTAACMLMRRELYLELGGFDEQTFPVPFNDVDLCIKILAAGRRIVWTPYATLWHDESASRGEGQLIERMADAAKREREVQAAAAMQLRWMPELARDRAFNKNLSLRNFDVRVGVHAFNSWSEDWRPRSRVVACRLDNHGVGFYRVKQPMEALRQAGMVQGFDSLLWLTMAELDRVAPDALVLQRAVSADRLGYIRTLARYSDAFRVYEIDDLLTDVPQDNPFARELPKDVERHMREAMSLCDRLVVSTEALADAYGDWVDGDVVVAPNRISRAIWGGLQPARAPRERPRVGWAGGLTHMADLELLAAVVRELSEEVDFVFLGICPPLLRPYVREVHVGVPIALYPRFLCDLDLDLALAPLTVHPFNEAKSPLKLLEYGALGYPVLCSDVLPYRGDWPVVRVRNRPRLWIESIRELLADPAHCQALGQALRAHVYTHYSLEDAAESWRDAWLPSYLRESARPGMVYQPHAEPVRAFGAC